MAVLSKSDRDNLDSSQFAGPGRTYPIPDKGHARAAITDASHAEHVGNISKSTEERIDAKAKAKLHDGKGGDPPADHKAAVAKMHPEHVHKLVEDAHAGKFGPEAQRHAQAAMQGQDGQSENDGDADDVGRPVSQARSIFGRGDDDQDDDAQPAGPADARSIFGR